VSKEFDITGVKPYLGKDAQMRSSSRPEPRRDYVVDKDRTDRVEASHACAAVLELLRPDLGLAVVDAYTDHAGRLTAEARQAEAWLRRRGAARAVGPGGAEPGHPFSGW